MAVDGNTLRQMAAAYATAWSSRNPAAVAGFFATDGTIAINGGDTLRGSAAIRDMAAGFFADFPDLVVRCDDARLAGAHALFVWTLEGHHVTTRQHVRIGGWEEWTLDDDLTIRSSAGWFDADDYARQVAEGSPRPG